MWLKPVLLNKQVPHKTANGFTLMEMMITIALITIVMAIAAPSLTDFIKNSRLTSTANNIVSDVIYARNEAVAKRATVTLSTTDSWSTWQVTDLGLDLGSTSDDVVLRSNSLEADISFVSFAGTGSSSGTTYSLVTSITFKPDGFRDIPTTNSVCFDLSSTNNSRKRQIRINPIGTTLVDDESGGCTSL